MFPPYNIRHLCSSKVIFTTLMNVKWGKFYITSVCNRVFRYELEIHIFLLIFQMIFFFFFNIAAPWMGGTELTVAVWRAPHIVRSASLGSQFLSCLSWLNKFLVKQSSIPYLQWFAFSIDSLVWRKKKSMTSRIGPALVLNNTLTCDRRLLGLPQYSVLTSDQVPTGRWVCPFGWNATNDVWRRLREWWKRLPHVTTS